MGRTTVLNVDLVYRRLNNVSFPMNPAVAFTLILLSLMIGSGVVSASWGFTLGRQALTGVRQPETRPNSGAPASRDTAPSGPNSVVLVNEAEVLQQVQSRISGGG